MLGILRCVFLVLQWLIYCNLLSGGEGGDWRGVCVDWMMERVNRCYCA